MKIRVFTNPERKDNVIKEDIENLLVSNGFEIDEENPNIVLYLGGDGTFLRAVHYYINKLDDIKFVGINFGKLGFFYDYQRDDLEILINDLINNNFRETSHYLLEGRVISNEKSGVIYAINEIRVESASRTLICDVLINNKPLETFHGNGLLVASALGSSAYNKSLNGSVVQPTIDCLQLTEIAAIQNNINRSFGSSLVLDKNVEITLKGEFRKSVIGFDYQTASDITLKELSVYLSDKKVTILHPKNYDYIKKLKRSFIQWWPLLFLILLQIFCQLL